MTGMSDAVRRFLQSPAAGRLVAPRDEQALVVIRRLLREGGRSPVIHMWKCDHATACGVTVQTLTGTWDDDDSKVTCHECNRLPTNRRVDTLTKVREGIQFDGVTPRTALVFSGGGSLGAIKLGMRLRV
jgi:hypothetical protein